MPVKRAPKTRRRPRQARSQATVDAILEATAQILAAEGYTRASTNAIARRAGVSVGSLYQYFPNKDAIVRALCERYIERLIAITHEEFAGMNEGSLEQGVRAVIGGIMRAEAAEPELNRLLHERVPRLIGHEHLDRANAVIVEALGEILKLRRGSGGLRSDVALDLAPFILLHAVLGVIAASLRERPEAVADGAITEELVQLVLRYLIEP